MLKIPFSDDTRVKSLQTYLLNVFTDSYERLYVDKGVELT